MKFKKVRAGWYRAECADGGVWYHVMNHDQAGWEVFTNETEHSVRRSDLRSSGFSGFADAKAFATELIEKGGS